jgi:hypothetical protein
LSTYGAVLIGRNDDYGENLVERTQYSLWSMLDSLDEVIYVDWNTENGQKPLPEILDLPKTKKFSYIVVPPEFIVKNTPNTTDQQVVCEVFARNIGLRRLKTDYLISTNPDIVCPERKELETYFTNKDALMTVPKRTISLYTLRDQVYYRDIISVRKILDANLYNSNQQPPCSVCSGDNYSLVSGCGDWEIGHRDIWYHIRGFEESLYKRAYADSNVLRKASYFGHRIYYEPAVKVWHIGHGRGGGGDGGENDMHTAIFMEGTSNPETWGFSKVKFKQRRIR